MKFSTAVARTLLIGAGVAITGTVCAQQDYPSKPIRFIVPYPAGGSPSILTRPVAQKLTEHTGQSVIIDNRPGGSTIIGAEALLKSAPDGYSIMLAAPTHVIIPSLLPKIPYDAIRDFAAVATLATSELILVLHPSVAANDLKEFIALAKSKPGQLNYASSGTGSTTHLAAALFYLTAGVEMQHIPFKGAAPAITDLIGGQVQLFFAGPSSILPHIKSGKLKAIAITGETRLQALSLVPTFAEAGLPGYGRKNWWGILAPARTPRAIIDKLSGEIAKILIMPDIKETLSTQGLDPFISTPDQFAALMNADRAIWAKVIKTANIKADD